MDWKELNGYNNNEKVPEYRKVRGFFEARNPYHGWIPIDDYGNLKNWRQCTSLKQWIRRFCEKL